MLIRFTLLAGIVAVLSACSTPYSPPVVVHGDAQEFDGIVELIGGSSQDFPLDVVLVHGMCSKDENWPVQTIGKIVQAIDSNVEPDTADLVFSKRRETIPVIEESMPLAGGTVRFIVPIWGSMTVSLKKNELAYDNTGEPTDCSSPGECRPTRASVNGWVKDKLLNDCLADVTIYQGSSDVAVDLRREMRNVIERVLAKPRNHSRSIVLIAESLGSKIVFDALNSILGEKKGEEKKAVLNQFAAVFMAANQLPILGLAERHTVAAFAAARDDPDARGDSLQRFLQKISPSLKDETGKSNESLLLTAFTDPNDLLSYRLQPSRYAGDCVKVADVLVSNDATFLGLLERPDTAHLNYLTNPDVASRIACGQPRSSKCK